MTDEELAAIKPLTKAQKVKLQKLIDRATKAHQAAFEATTALNAWCDKVYGFTAGDVDADSIIDAVLGGCGSPSGMSAEQFNDEMTWHRSSCSATRRNGR